MRAWWRAVLLVALLLRPQPVTAQTLSPGLQQRLREFSSKAPSSWTAADYDEFERVVIAVSREILESGLTGSERARLRGIDIAVDDLEGAPPAWVEHGAIRISSDAMGEAALLGMYVGHDIYVTTGSEFGLGAPLLTRPFAARAVLPLMGTLHDISLAGFSGDLVKCPSTVVLCAQPQGTAIFVGTVGFLIAHEMSHVLLGHQQVRVRSTEEELAADAKAWSILQRVAPGATEDSESLELRVQVAIEAGPLVMLRWIQDSQQPDSPAADAVYGRISALNDRVSESVSYEVGSIVDEEPVVDRLRSIQVSWNEVPDELYIDGWSAKPSEVSGKTLRVLGRVQVLARKGARFAFATLPASPTSQPERLALVYQPLAERVPSASQLSEWRRRREWFNVLLGTATPELAPRSGAPPKALFEAMDRLGLGRLIDPVLAGPSGRDRRLPRYWQARGQPLGRWRPIAP